MTAVQSSLAELLGLSLASHRPFRASLPATPPVEDLPPSTAHFLPAARALVDYCTGVRTLVKITPHMQNRVGWFQISAPSHRVKTDWHLTLARRFIIDGATTNNTTTVLRHS